MSSFRNDRHRGPQKKRQSGFTLVEVMTGLVVMGCVSVIMVPRLVNPQSEAMVVRCAADMLAIETDIENWSMQTRLNLPVAMYRANPAQFRHVKGIYYLVDGDPNSGHGNDIDECDEENPGVSGAKRDCYDIDWVLLCEHDHGGTDSFLFMTNDGVPTLYLEGWAPHFIYGIPTTNVDPGYRRYIKLQYKG